jgi:hypothetical protein
MFFFRPGSNFCILENERITNSSKDFVRLGGPAYLSTVHLVLTRDFAVRRRAYASQDKVHSANHRIKVE